MRRKIKGIMRKEEGFTLVELLAVIVILGIILAIAVPSVGNLINKTQEKADEAEQELIIDAARIYFTVDEEDVKKPHVTIKKLIDEGYLELKDANRKKYEGKSVRKINDRYEIGKTPSATG